MVYDFFQTEQNVNFYRTDAKGNFEELLATWTVRSWPELRAICRGIALGLKNSRKTAGVAAIGREDDIDILLHSCA